jgi:hypothetical protein
LVGRAIHQTGQKMLAHHAVTDNHQGLFAVHNSPPSRINGCLLFGGA